MHCSEIHHLKIDDIGVDDIFVRSNKTSPASISPKTITKSSSKKACFIVGVTLYNLLSFVFKKKRQPWLVDRRRLNLKTRQSFRRKFSLHSTLYRSSDNVRTAKHFCYYLSVLVTSVAVDMALSMKLLTMKYAKSENVISLIWLGVEINMSKNLFLVQTISSQKFASNLVKIWIFQ